MHRHLTEQEICEWAMGELNSDWEDHILGCESCRAEVVRMTEVLAAFRVSAHERAREIATPEMAPARAWPAVAKVLAAAMVFACCLAVALMLPRHRAVTDNREAQDAVLLNRIEADISRTIPESMEPLRKLAPRREDLKSDE